MTDVLYGLEADLSAREFQDVLVRATFAERRPADDLARLETMLRRADIIVTARQSGRLVGIARALSDFSYCCYLSDLCVDAALQRRGIGRALIARTQAAAGPRCMLLLLAAPAAVGYYPHIGMRPHDSAWILDRRE
jgi:GNAT superfamily N-acetyltransferase